MSLGLFAWGFFIKAVLGFDDALTHTPILANITKTQMGRQAYAVGAFIAVIFSIIIAFFFSALIGSFEFYPQLIAALLFILATAIYFDVFVTKPRV